METQLCFDIENGRYSIGWKTKENQYLNIYKPLFLIEYRTNKAVMGTMILAKIEPTRKVNNVISNITCLSIINLSVFIQEIDMIKHFVILCLVLSLITAEKDYTDLVKFLKTKIEDKNGPFYHSAYNRLAYISDTYGPRMWGSNTLQTVISQMAKMAIDEGFDSVHLEPVSNFTKWVRGKESLTLYSPRPTPQKLDLIGLGKTISGNVKADAIVFRDYDELQANKDKIKGKIVVYNQKWTTYGESVQYRSSGADRAAKYGAVAALVRSVTSFSVSSVHTGMQYSTAIPIAAITVEDAEMFQRMQDRGQKITLQLVLENQLFPNTYSNNLIFEIKGSEKPDQILLMGGHIDSWDTGSQTGANDDGGGFITCFDAMRLLLKNGLRPKRTIRFIAWSGQEWGDPKNGNKAYLAAHLDELPKHIVAFQDDLGSTKLLGFGYQGDPRGKEVVQFIANKYMSILNASLVTNDGGGVDTGPLYERGVPTMANSIFDNQSHDFYFTYHHSAGDSMTMMNADDLDSNVVGVAAMFYILADLDNTIPRTPASNLQQE